MSMWPLRLTASAKATAVRRRVTRRRKRKPQRVGGETRPGERWYSNTMRSTIDKAGRVVIPASIRDRAGLTPGTALEVTADDTGVRIERVAPGPKLVRIGKRLVARPTVGSDRRPDVDVAALIEDERNRWP